MFSNSFEIVENDPQGDYQVVEFVGEMDSANLREKKDEFEEKVRNLKVDYLVLDLGKLQFLNSEGINYLLNLNQILEKSKKKMVLIKPKQNVEDVLGVIGFYQMVPKYNSVEAFKKMILDGEK